MMSFVAIPQRWHIWDLLEFIVILGQTSSTIDICTFLLGWVFYGIQTTKDAHAVAVFHTQVNPHTAAELVLTFRKSLVLRGSSHTNSNCSSSTHCQGSFLPESSCNACHLQHYRHHTARSCSSVHSGYLVRIWIRSRKASLLRIPDR